MKLFRIVIEPEEYHAAGEQVIPSIRKIKKIHKDPPIIAKSPENGAMKT